MNAFSVHPCVQIDSSRRTVPEVSSKSTYLDWDALQVALTRLDHSPQNYKASIGRSGALSNRRPPSRSSRASSYASRKSSIDRLEDFAGLDEDLVIPKIVNIEIRLEGEEKPEEKVTKVEESKSESTFNFRHQSLKSESKSVEDILCNTTFSVSDNHKNSFYQRKHGIANSIFKSTPLLSNFPDNLSVSSDIILRNIKNTYSKEAKSEGYKTPNTFDSQSDKSSTYSYPFPRISKEKYDNVESSSEAEVIISDRESIADSGIVNRRTVIKICEKSKSASNLDKEKTTSDWVRDLQHRRSLRASKELEKVNLTPSPVFCEGINVSIKNPAENNDVKRRDSTSRMYVRQGDTENRPARASAFNVRRTIQKRQIQQERRERKALREQIREHLRSLSEGRERRESSSCSSISSTNQSSASLRSKSLSSLDQDHDDLRSESPLFKAQSSPTLDSEKEGIRTYLFGSNLSDSSVLRSSLLVSRIMSPTFSEISRPDTVNSSEGLNRSYHDKNISKPDTSPSNANERLTNFKVHSVERLDYHQNKKVLGGSASNIFNDSNIDNNFLSKKFNTEETKTITNCPNCGNIRRTANTSGIPAASNHQSSEYQKHPEQYSPIPPPRRRSRVSRSTGQLTVEKDDKPAWLRLAKERRSLRGTKTYSDISDRASSIVAPEPDWVTKARKRLESMNVCLTSTTDTVSVNSQITESSAWSRGGLDALEDLREEVNRISEELADEASERVARELGITDRVRSTNMLEYHPISHSRDHSVERQRVSFDGTAVQNEKTRKLSLQNLQKDEVRFGDLKHDWGGAQVKSSRGVNGKLKETRFSNDQVSETIADNAEEINNTNSTSNKHESKDYVSPEYINMQNGEIKSNQKSDKLLVMHFGDTPQDIFTKSTSKVKSQSSSKFESIAGPDPLKMTAEELNQNVEEYDFPIPTGKEDATELLNYLKESLNKQEMVPEFVSNEDSKPKPKSILKRKSMENVFQETKTEAKSETFNSSKPQLGSSATEEASKIDEGVAVTELLKPKSFVSKYEDKYHNHTQPATTAKVPVSSSSEPGVPGAKVYTFSFNPYQKSFPASLTKDASSEEVPKTYFGDVNTHPKSSEAFTDFKSDVTKFKTKSSENDDSSQRLLTKTEKISRRDDLFGRRSLRESSSRVRAPMSSIHISKNGKSMINDSNPIVQLIQKSPESCKKDIYHYTPKEVNIDIVDANRRSLPSSLEKRRNKSSLFEWEAIQRQRLEDEEKNRLNKNLSIKPVSDKIKDLVKIHSGIVASMFTKDKKGEYNGTVDAKEEIFFQKIPNNAKPEIPPRNFSNAMKSPYIVQNILNPKPGKEKEVILDKTSSDIKPKQDKKTITPSLEREAYMFNQRNIYIEDDTIHKQRTKEKRHRIENIQSLIGKREKKYELNESKPFHSVINKTDLDESLIKPKNIDNNINKHEDSKSPYKKKEWINNVLNNLSNERHETASKTEKTDDSLIEDSSATDLKRSSVYRRTFHECLPRKETTKDIPVKRSSADDLAKVQKNVLESNLQRKDVPIKMSKTDESVTGSKNILESNFQRKDSKRLYLKKGEGRGPVNLTSIIGDTPSASSSNVSSPLTSPRSSPERRISNDYFKMSPISETHKYTSTDPEKENVCPIKNKLENDSANSNIFKYENSYLASTINHSSSSAVKSLLDRSDPNRRSLSKLLQAWEERASKERSASPSAYSDNTNINDYKIDPLSGYPIPLKSPRERTLSLRSSSSIRSTPDRDRPVSLSSILERDVSSPTSSTHRLSVSEELNELTQNYRKEKAKKLLSNESNEKVSGSKPNYHFGMPIEGIHNKNSNTNTPKDPIIKNYSHSSSKSLDTNRKRSHQKDAKKSYTTSKTIKKQVKESHIYNNCDKEPRTTSKREDVRPSFQTKPTSKDVGRPNLVRRKSSLKRSQSGDSSSLSSFRRDSRRDSKKDTKRDVRTKEKVHAKKSKDSDTASERYESIRQNPDGSKTKTSIRKVRLSSSTNPDKIISRCERDKNSQERFKLDASRDLENWAAGMKVQGQLVKKEGQRYVQHVEEELEGGKKTSKAVSRRVVRRGSRRLSQGGELVSETKEMTSGDPSGKSSDIEPHQGENSICTALVPRTGGLDPTSRKLKSSTDGERYVTQSITTEGGIQRFTTEGVDNKTTKCVEVIGGDGWEGEREVKGRHGERLIVERSVGVHGRPSTVVKKSTSQSKVIITKTKKKALNI